MDATRKNLGSVVKGWFQGFGYPTLVIAIVLACMAIIAHELFAPIPLNVAIQKDLQTSEQIESGQAAPADPSQSSK